VTPAGEIPRPEPVRLAATRPAAAPTTTAPAAATPTTRTAATAGEETLAALQAQREALLAQLADARARQDKFVATVNQAAARSDTAAGENARRAVAECQTMIKAIEARITAVQKNIVARTPVPK
jgi:seryl-tRNA synthetase